MTAQELIDIIVLHYNGAPDTEALSIGHWTRPAWSAPVQHFSPQIAVTVGELRGMASPNALAASGNLQAMRMRTENAL